eukprot:9381129-Pyramimonas_sp.AAC.1
MCIRDRVLEASRKSLEASCSRSWAHLGPVLGLCKAPLQQSWKHLGPSWGRPEGLLGGLGAVLGASSALSD